MKYDDFLIKSWWVWAFAIVCFSLYEQSAMKLEKEMVLLDGQIASLEKKIFDAKKTQGDLKLQVESFNDSASIERTLIRALGLVPEGYTKVYYREASPP